LPCLILYLIVVFLYAFLYCTYIACAFLNVIPTHGNEIHLEL